MILAFLANHWLLIAAVVVTIAAVLQPVLVWKFKAWILLAAVLWWGWTGHAAADALQAKADGERLEIARQAAKASEEARKAEQAHAAALDAIAKQYETDKANAQAKHDAVVAGLRSGQLRMRDHWQGCAVSDPATGSGVSDEGARLRAESAARIIAAAAEADAQVRAAQEVIKADRNVR